VSVRRAATQGPDSYIVRIYRRAANPADPAAGTVERADGGDAARFASAEELWAFLMAPAAGRARRRTSGS
jgi:hypothetical protein